MDVREGSWFEPLKDVQGELAGIVSNPPYIPSENILRLQAEVGRHEPRLALDGGVDGMDHLLHLCHGATSMLTPGGYFAFEVLLFCCPKLLAPTLPLFSSIFSFLLTSSRFLQTNGGKQSKLLLDYMEKELKGSFFNVKVVPDFVGVQRFVTGFRQ